LAYILLVEDERAIRELVTEALQLEGYAVRTARDGREALCIALAERPELIVTDLMLPRMGGLECLGAIAERVERMPPALVVSASYPKVKRDYRFTWEFLPKPFDIETLLEKVRELMA